MSAIELSLGYNNKVEHFYIRTRGKLQKDAWKNYFFNVVQTYGGNIKMLDTRYEKSVFEGNKEIDPITNNFKLGYDTVFDVKDGWKAYVSENILQLLVEELKQINSVNERAYGVDAKKYVFFHEDAESRLKLVGLGLTREVKETETKIAIVIENEKPYATVYHTDKFTIDRIYRCMRDITKGRNEKIYGREAYVDVIKSKIEAFKGSKGDIYYMFKIGVGLVDYIISLASEDTYLKQFTIKVVDNREPGEKNKFDVEKVNAGRWDGFYDYQKEAIKKILKYYNGIIKIATGGGKTILSMGVIGEIGEDTIFIVPTRALAMQVYREFKKKGFPSVGIFYGDDKVKNDPELQVKDTPGLDVNVAVVNSASSIFKQESRFKTKASSPQKIELARKRSEKTRAMRVYFKEILSKANVIIFDEAHHIKASSWDFLNDSVKATYRYGLTATPFKDKSEGLDSDDALVRNALGSVIVDISSSDLINRQNPKTKLPYLARPIIKICDVPIPPVEWMIKLGIGGMEPNLFRRAYGVYENYRRDPKYRRYLEEDSRGMLWWKAVQDVFLHGNPFRDMIIVETCKRLNLLNMQTIIIADYIVHQQTLQEMLKRANINSVIINSKTREDDREQLFNRVRQNKVNFLIGSSAMLGEGIDIPNLMCAIIVDGGKSFIKSFQRIGRVLRVHPEQKTMFRKTHSLIIELNDVQDLSLQDEFYLNFVDYGDRNGLVKRKIYMMPEMYEERREAIEKSAIIPKQLIEPKFRSIKVPIRSLGKQLEQRIAYYKREPRFVVQQVTKYGDIFMLDGKDVWKK